MLEDLLTEAPDQDDELYNPESERDVSDKKGGTAVTTGTGATGPYGTDGNSLFCQEQSGRASAQTAMI